MFDRGDFPAGDAVSVVSSRRRADPGAVARTGGGASPVRLPTIGHPAI